MVVARICARACGRLSLWFDYLFGYLRGLAVVVLPVVVRFDVARGTRGIVVQVNVARALLSLFWISSRLRESCLHMRGLPTVFGFLSFFPHATPFPPHPPPPPFSTRAIKSTKTPPISLEFVLRACGLYELSFTRLGALFLAVLSCFLLDFVLLRPQPRRDRHPYLLSPERHTTFFRPRGTRLLGTPPSFGYGDNIFGGNLGVTSLRDTVFFGTLHVSHTTLRPSGTPRPSGTLGLWARPIPPHQQPRKQYRTSFPKPPL
jgi:hypothetical protein